MATGGIFQLITNDGKQDRMLMASALLKQRIDDARSATALTTTPPLTKDTKAEKYLRRF